jgi:hypothetical protein
MVHGLAARPFLGILHRHGTFAVATPAPVRMSSRHSRHLVSTYNICLPQQPEDASGHAAPGAIPDSAYSVSQSGNVPADPTAQAPQCQANGTRSCRTFSPPMRERDTVRLFLSLTLSLFHARAEKRALSAGYPLAAPGRRCGPLSLSCGIPCGHTAAASAATVAATWCRHLTQPLLGCTRVEVIQSTSRELWRSAIAELKDARSS